MKAGNIQAHEYRHERLRCTAGKKQLNTGKKRLRKKRVETSACEGVPSRRVEPVPVVVVAPRGVNLQRVLEGLLEALHCVTLHRPLWQEVVAMHKPEE